jgi:hypothetical protein
VECSTPDVSPLALAVDALKSAQFNIRPNEPEDFEVIFIRGHGGEEEVL